MLETPGSDVRHTEERVRRSITDGCLLSAGDTVVVAVSGGPDSLCLLHVLAHLSTDLSISLHVAHLNHLLRGGESQAEERFVAGQAAALGLPCTLGARDVRAHASLHRHGLEEAGRELRYAFLAEVAQRTGASRIATGHTKDDLVETVLMNVLRGAGIHGLRGLDLSAPLPVSGPHASPSLPPYPRLIRPLLDVSRDETAAYCAAVGLEPRIDESNESPEFLRNRVRHELLPVCRQLNPGVDAALLRLAVVAREDDALLSGQASLLWAAVETGPGYVRVPLAVFGAAAPAIQARLVRLAFEHLRGDARDVTMAHVRAVQSLAEGPGGRAAELPHAVVWRREGETMLAFVRGADPDAADPEMPEVGVPLAVPGETLIPGWRISARIEESAETPASDQPLSALLDAGSVRAGLCVRRRRPGDRIRPLGMTQEKKLQDVMVDCKVPSTVRSRVPIVCSGDDIVWVAGCRMDDRFKVTPETRTFLHLTFIRVHG